MDLRNNDITLGEIMQNKDNDKELKEILKKIEILDDLLESVKREDKEKRKQEEQ